MKHEIFGMHIGELCLNDSQSAVGLLVHLRVGRHYLAVGPVVVHAVPVRTANVPFLPVEAIHQKRRTPEEIRLAV